MSEGTYVNDVHAQLNRTRVTGIRAPRDAAEAAAALAEAARAGRPVSLCGARHAMGGQQFGTDTVLLDLRGLNRLGPVDAQRGLVEAGAGLTWPELMDGLLAAQHGATPVWSIRQKQTGADDLTLGGALAANIHGRGLKLPPFVGDIEAFTLLDARGAPHRCSRAENADLFRLAIGGYGCFGVVTSLCLRLAPRHKVERVVEILDASEVPDAFARRLAAGFEFGDWQFSIDENAPDFLQRGVCSCYRPVADDRAVTPDSANLQAADWERLLAMAHTDRGRIFAEYAGYYLSTQGRVYWSDTHQLGVYIPHYHEALDRRLGAAAKATEMITELYVPRARLADFMARAAAELRPRGVPVIYGTVRLIERDTETLLAWARADFACVIFNLHTEHTARGVARAQAAFLALIDLALDMGGSFFLTYHRWARRDQLERAYPQLREFMRRKRQHDPDALFQSDWWRHLQHLFGEP